MTIPVSPTTSITSNGAEYLVADQSDDVKRMVAVIDELRQRESDLQLDLFIIKSAMNAVEYDLSKALEK